MKKFLFCLLFVLSIIVMPENVSAKSKVTIYIFRGSTCSHCEEAITYFNKHKDEINENIEVVTYEVWENANNARLQENVAEKVKVSEKYLTSVPLIVIGEKHITGYSGVSTYNEIMTIAESYFNNEDYKDVVKETIKELNINVESKTLNELFPEPNKVVTIVVYSIFGAIVLGFVAMIVFSRK